MNYLKQGLRLTVLLSLTLVLSYCGGSSDSGNGNGGNGGNNQVSLSTTPNPAEGGSINPSSGNFNPGTDVTVEALPSNGWEFVEWTGDIQSTDNPLTFTIQSNTSLTANFNAVNSIYTMDLTVADSLNSRNLGFGQDQNSSSATDDAADMESPPPPPSGAFDAFLKSGTVRLVQDFRSFTTDSIDWNLQYQMGSGDSLFLSWTLTQTRLEGTLNMVSSDNSIQVDMLNQQNFAFPVTAADSLIIQYRFQDQ
ncbi:MAG: hypothetical protein R3211_11155 [Balneolaceae bacterium]|nr:hypothetical protein [Balneolaceae bacterium]